MPRGPRPRSLRTHLSRVVTALVTGCMLGCLAILWNLWETHKQSIHASIGQTASVLALAIDKELESALPVAQTLAATNLLQRGDFAAFHRIARRALQDRPGAWIVLFDHEGRRLLHTSAPYGEDIGNLFQDERDDPRRAPGQLTFGSTVSVRSALDSGKPVYSQLFFARRLEAPALAIDVPVTLDDGKRYVLSMGIPAARIQALVMRAELPEHVSASVVDSDGFIVARSKSPERFIGKQGGSGLLAALKAGLLFWDSPMTLDGDPAFAGLRRSAVAPLAAVVWIPKSYYLRTFHRSGALWLAAAVLFIGLGILMAARLADRVARGLLRLDPERRTEDGEPPPQTGIAELDRVADALRLSAMFEEARRHETALRLEEESRRKEAEKSARSKDEFLAAVSHELRNPLATIRNVAYILGLRERSQEETKLVGMLNRQTDFLQQLVDDLLDTAKAAFGQLALAVEPQNLGLLAEQACCEALAGSPHASEHCNVAAQEVWIKGDAERLRQVLRHVIQNALKFTPPEGCIGVSVYAQGGQAVVEVSDSGSGIDEALLPDMFEPFVQGTQDAARGQGGLGLGLTLVKHIVALHGGQVSAANNRTGAGATVHLRFPLLKCESSDLMAA